MGMKQRCMNPNSHIWKYYGGRGIKVCARWLGRVGFDNFVDDMGPKPTPQHTLDRVDNDGDYAPGNCRWASMKEQALNRRATGPKNDPNSLRSKSRSAGLPYHVVYCRVKRFGWPEPDALATPVQRPGWNRRDASLAGRGILGLVCHA